MSRTIEAIVAEYVENHLVEEGRGPLAHDASLSELGVLDSMAVAAILAFTESEFGIVIEECEIAIENVDSVDAIAALVRSKLATLQESAS